MILNNLKNYLCNKCLQQCRLIAPVRFLKNEISLETPENSSQSLGFSDQEEEKILNIINESNTNDLLKLNISETRIKHLNSYKRKNGVFKSLEELLNVDGISNTKSLVKLCKQFISDAPLLPQKTVYGNKKIKQFVIPNDVNQNAISSIVGLHLCPAGVSWAKISKHENYLEAWDHQLFEDLPKKLLHLDTFKQGHKILKIVPVGDVYVFEGSPNMGLLGQRKPAAVTSYTQQMELTAMLLALINTSTTHNAAINKINQNNSDFQDRDNRVYYLRSRLPARLFKTFVGNECVSNIDVIHQLLSHVNWNLPCTPIKVEDDLRMKYLNETPSNQELLGQALMVTLTFTDICIRGNPSSLDAVAPNKKK